MHWLWLLLAVQANPATEELRTAAAAREEAELLVAEWRRSFASPPVRAMDCGVPVDGESDATEALNRCIALLPPWSTLDGESLRYAVTQVDLRSQLRLRNFHFLKRGSGTDGLAAVSLNGQRSPQSDVLLEDISVDGRRSSESGLDSPSTEDGGRHCFRLTGQLSRVGLLHVRGNFCGTDGLHLAGHHATASDEPLQLPLQQIVVRDAEFRWNRRAGITFEGGHRLYFLGVRAQFNGRTLTDAPDDPRSGAYCANVGRFCFGTGVWTENDHDAAGGSFDRVAFVDLDATGNQRRGFYAYSQSHPGVTGFRPKSGLLLADSVIDAGIAPIPGNPQAIQFLAAGADGWGTIFRDVRVVNSRVEGTIGARALDGLELDNVTSNAPLLGFLEFFDRVRVHGGQRQGDFASTLWRRPDGTPNPTVEYDRPASPLLPPGQR